MEAKASRMSQRSSSNAVAAATKVGKVLSKASLTPSQMSERTRMNMPGNRDPLDALSRSAMPPPYAERRSGLQDVDDDYLKTVVYGFGRQAGQASQERSKVTAEMQPAGVPTARTPFVSASDRPAAGANDSAQAGKAPAAVPQQTNAQMAPQAMQPQAAQAQPQVQGQALAGQKQQQQTTIQVPIQMQNAQPKVAQNSVQAEKPQSPQDNAGQMRQGGSGCGDPELYTTCPNCQATLYLSRNAGEPSPYGNQGDGAQQAQAQQ